MIHILYRGLPLCLFSDKVPSDWPHGHKWISYEDPKVEEDADCDECKDQRSKVEYLRRGKGMT